MNALDKEEFRIKLEEINRLVEKKNYKDAMEVVDSIDWRRVKNVRTLCVVGEIYAANKRYEDSKEIFLLAYHRAPIGKNILYRLIEVSLKMKDIDEAMEFYEEFLEVAPNDSTQYILKYKIEKANHAPLEEQIRILEEYKEKEFTERWSYELAKLYYQNGDNQKCLDICNEMIIWFNDGKYVMKALDLKNRMGQLTGAEKEKYEKKFIPNLKTVEEVSEEKEETPDQKEEAPAEEDAPVIESVSIDERDVNSAESLQEKISKGIRDIFNGSKKKDGEEDFLKEEEDGSSEEIQDEMIRDISDKPEPTNVPELEAEDVVTNKAVVDDMEKAIEATTEKEIKEDATPVQEKIKLPELEIPESMKNMGMENPLHTAVPKAPDICLPGTDEPKEEDKDFNLEDTILAAATAQGIEIPEETPAAPKKKQPAEEVDEDYMTEEDLREAEQEFLNGPSNKKQDAFVMDEDDEDEDFSEEDGYEDEDPGYLEEEFSEEPEKKMNEEEELEAFIDSMQPEKDYEDIIPREKKLTEDEEKLFTYFAKVPGLREQIVDTLYDVQICASDKTSKTGNVIVMGGRETGKTRLISGLIPAICKELGIEASKVAYVFADQINGKKLHKAMEFRTDGLIVIIEDEKIGMRKLIARFPKFTSKFTSMINIPVFTNDELVNFAKVYTRENGYTIDQMGMLALYNLISTSQKEDQPMNVGAVKELIDNAISKSRGGIRKLISKKKVNADGYQVLYEKDFS